MLSNTETPLRNGRMLPNLASIDVHQVLSEGLTPSGSVPSGSSFSSVAAILSRIATMILLWLPSARAHVTSFLLPGRRTRASFNKHEQSSALDVTAARAR